MTLLNLKKEIKKLGTPERAKASLWFFKTGKGQYGEGDVFVGLTVPQSRKVAMAYKSLPLSDIKKLLKSKIHEERLIALFILVYKFQESRKQKSSVKTLTDKEIFDFYLSHSKHINNWDLVDSSADKIVGEYLLDKPRKILYTMATSLDMWERRISIISTYAFIKKGEYTDTFKISELLLKDKHDLIHKAVGWMLREVGKRCSRDVLVEFLKTHYKTMPRTTLRYAIEHFPQDVRKRYLLGQI